jgi:hypothetical protein
VALAAVVARRQMEAQTLAAEVEPQMPQPETVVQESSLCQFLNRLLQPFLAVLHRPLQHQAAVGSTRSLLPVHLTP